MAVVPGGRCFLPILAHVASVGALCPAMHRQSALHVHGWLPMRRGGGALLLLLRRRPKRGRAATRRARRR